MTNSIFFEPGNHKAEGLTHSPFKALIAPRPIGWVSSQSQIGIANLGAYSFFNAVSELPPMVMFAAAPDRRTDKTGHKDSWQNIQDTKEFGLNIVGADLLEKMIKSSEPVEPDIDEFAYAGLTKIYGKYISAPLVGEAAAHLECTLFDTLQLPGTETKGGVRLVFGTVVGIHIRTDIIKDGKVDNTAFRQASRLGYRHYAIIDKMIEG